MFYTSGFVNSQGYNWAEFKRTLRQNPVGIAFGVADQFMFYSGGVYDGACAYGVNHGMNAIGYGYD